MAVQAAEKDGIVSMWELVLGLKCVRVTFPCATVSGVDLSAPLGRLSGAYL